MIDKYLVAVLGSVFLFGCSLIQPIKEEVKLTADSKTVVPIVVSVYQPYSEKGGAGRYAIR